MLHAFRSSAIRATMGPSTVKLKDLMKGRPVTIYLVLPIEPTSNAAGVNATMRREESFFQDYWPMEAER